MGAGVEILVFEHPLAGWQIAKGTVEEGEDVAEAALRELAEESGVTEASIVGKIGTLESVTGGGPNGTGPLEKHVWHLFHVEAAPLVESRAGWTHMAEGSPEERGLAFRFFWLDTDAALDSFHPFWGEVFVSVRNYLKPAS